MDKVKLSAVSRIEKGNKVNSGRKKGLVPAVIYGKGIKTEMLWVKAMELEKLLAKSGESVIIELSIDGKNIRNVLIHEIQKDPVRGTLQHIDFYQVRMTEKIEAEVELVLIGESPAVKELAGILVRSVDKLKIKCLPADLPSHIDVDVSKIKTFEDHICVKDLNISDKVEIEIDPETVVALATPPRSEEELSALEEKVEEDVTKVEGVVKEVPVEGEVAEGEKKPEGEAPAPEKKKE
ncbi:MAG: 50S ribosomal protein L25 [Candidatus Moranbacteria bacterium]|nr:50S ribosomal protein L25 [Candidatus Moranbacteria bacterium]